MYMGKIRGTYVQTVKELEKMKASSDRVIQSTLNDFRKRGPSWIAAEVAQHYGIKKNDINPNVKNGGTAGKIKVAGRTATAFSRKVTKLAIAVSSMDS